MINKIDTIWQPYDYNNLDYKILPAYGEDNMQKYLHKEYKDIICNYVYHLPKPMPKFVDKILQQFEYKIKSPAINLMTPGQILPLHQDTYTKFIEKYNINSIEDIIRYIIFLEDAQPGHLMQIQDTVYANWKSGDVVSWNGSQTHAAYNLGHTNRYTLQITCVDKI